MSTFIEAQITATAYSPLDPSTHSLTCSVKLLDDSDKLGIASVV
jgi:hypothetical protein